MLRNLLGALLFIGIFVVLGLALGAWAMEVVYDGASIPWYLVPLPGGHQPSQFVFHEGPYAYVQTTGGELFAQLLRPDELFPWERVENLPLPGDHFYTHATADCSRDPQDFDGRWTLEPPGEIRSEILCGYMRHAEYTGEIRFVILEDESIWRWAHVNPGMAGLGIFLYYSGRGILGGALFGLMVYIAFLISMKMIRASRVQETAGASLPGRVYTIEPHPPETKDKSPSIFERMSGRDKLITFLLMAILLIAAFWITFQPFVQILLEIFFR